MKKESRKGTFSITEGSQNSLTIFRLNGLKPIQIGFISDIGEFFLDTNHEQIHIYPEHLAELGQFVEENIELVLTR